MIVSELIEHLKTLPQDYPVIYALFSDFTALGEEDIRIISAESKDVLLRNGNYTRP